MGEDLVVGRQLVIPAVELSERFSRSSGPGGQSVNTTDSRVELTFDLERSATVPDQLKQRALRHLGNRLVGGTITIAASEHRSQLANRQAARERLAALLAEAIAPPAPRRRPTRPTRGSKQRRLTGKKIRSAVKKQRRRGDPGE